MNNTRFATALHIMTILAAMPEQWLSSEFIASSINVNAVVIRRELSVLNAAGLIISKKGKEGGVQLGKTSKDIMLSDIYLAVKNSEVLGKKNNNPNPACPIGKQINSKLDNLFTQTDLLVVNDLRKKNLKEFTQDFN